EAPLVLDASCADALLVLGGEGTSLVDAKAAGVRIDAVPSMDPPRRIARGAFARVRATPLDADARRLRLEGAVLAAAEALGVAERAVEMSVEYAKVRQQFGKPI